MSLLKVYQKIIINYFDWCSSNHKTATNATFQNLKATSFVCQLNDIMIEGAHECHNDVILMSM